MFVHSTTAGVSDSEIAPTTELTDGIEGRCQAPIDQKRMMRRNTTFWKLEARSPEAPKHKAVFLLRGSDEQGTAGAEFLTVISGHAQLMVDEEQRSVRQEHAEQILQQFDVLTAMQREVLDFARGKSAVSSQIVTGPLL